MILRAIFWIGLVSLFMPHEPDLGFGRPGAVAAAAPRSIPDLIQASNNVPSACGGHPEMCAHGLSILDGFQAFAVRAMDGMKADIVARHAPEARASH